MQVLGEDLPIEEDEYSDRIGGLLRDIRSEQDVTIEAIGESGPHDIEKIELIERGQITPGESALLTYAVAVTDEDFTFRDYAEELVRRLLSPSS